MSRLNLYWQSFLIGTTGMLAGWAINNLPSAKELNLPIPVWVVLAIAIGASAGLNLLPALLGNDSRTDARTSAWSWLSCLLPLLASGALFFLVKAGHIPPEMTAGCLYTSLGLFVFAAVFPPVLVLLNTRTRLPIATQATTSAFAKPQDELRIRTKLLKAVSTEVEGQLKTAFHNHRLVLEKEEYPAAIQRPWDKGIKFHDNASLPLPTGTSIVSVFDRTEVAGRLLILGNPGAGKTITLLELAAELVKRAQRQAEEPIPVIVRLSSWKGEQQRISDWLTEELIKLEGELREAIVQQWLREGKLLPLLDGLDEVAPGRQMACVQAINRFQQNYAGRQLVVCSRSDEYKQMQEQLQLNAAVYLKPLEPNQIQEYLLQVGSSELWAMVEADLSLMSLVQTPFFLRMVSIVWRNINFPTVQQHRTIPEWRRQILDAYINQKLKEKANSEYARNVKKYAENAKHWLSWLANGLQNRSQDEIFIEKLQPTWLSNSTLLNCYRIANFLLFGLFFGLILGLRVGLISGLGVGLMFGLTSGLTVGLPFWLVNGGLSSEIAPSETLVWNAQQGLLLGLMFGLMFGLVSGLMGGVSVGLISGLFFGLLFGLLGGLKSTDLEIRIKPNQGIWVAQSNALIFGLLFGLIGGLIAALIFELTGALRVGLTIHLMNGLLFGLLFGLIGGGVTVIKHLVLRITLKLCNYTPWNYAQFLNHATDDLIFLQRVGGGYQFIHALLRDRFAELWRESQ